MIMMSSAKYALLLGTLLLAASGCGKAKYICQSKQAEAKATLKTVRSSEASYLDANKKYSGSLTELAIPTDMARSYTVTVDSATATGYGATATGKDDMAGDVWKIDETATEAKAVTDKCSSM